FISSLNFEDDMKTGVPTIPTRALLTACHVLVICLFAAALVWMLGEHLPKKSSLFITWYLLTRHI
ncbi:hypothetical protein BDR04DRAFT_1103414, partial [Suillus decipiens]